jgi:hypothetical protein
MIPVRAYASTFLIMDELGRSYWLYSVKVSHVSNIDHSRFFE